MESTAINVLLIVTVALAVALVYTLRNRRSDGGALFEQTMAKIASEALKNSQEQFLALAQEKLEGHRSLASKDLEHKKETIANLIEEVRKGLKSSDDARITTFASLAKEIELQKQVMHELRASTDDLKRVLSNNQLRGAFGEQVAENLLKMAGFVTGQDYVFNREQESEETRPDFTIFLPDRTKINIDVKFPYQALVKMSATEDRGEKDQHFRQFTSDVKQKIKQVTTRGYINPEDKTVDFVILFIPNEMIFSFIYDQMNEVWEDAMQKKVILAGPFSFTAILRMIKQAYSNFRYQENLHQVIGLIHKFETEYTKYGEAVDTLGDRIQSVVKQFDTMSGTRSRALNKIFDQIKNQNVLPSGQESEE
ncbi:DNA recombination protein RmuC [Candidatus Uhrbacteria bacterium]|nr:DNA recombination protein RmuC [Candidatus Uhrbacteria bacterium]